MREKVRERECAPEREQVGEWGFKESKGSLKLKPSAFNVEFKSFLIEMDGNSRGDTIYITERCRLKSYKIGIGLGCASWLIEQLGKAREAGERFFCKSYRGNNYIFWLEKYKNKNGVFLKLSQCGRNGFVHTVILPKGQRDVSYRLDVI
jgi:hypothetical protein